MKKIIFCAMTLAMLFASCNQNGPKFSSIDDFPGEYNLVVQRDFKDSVVHYDQSVRQNIFDTITYYSKTFSKQHLTISRINDSDTLLFESDVYAPAKAIVSNDGSIEFITDLRHNEHYYLYSDGDRYWHAQRTDTDYNYNAATDRHYNCVIHNDKIIWESNCELHKIIDNLYTDTMHHLDCHSANTATLLRQF